MYGTKKQTSERNIHSTLLVLLVVLSLAIFSGGCGGSSSSDDRAADEIGTGNGDTDTGTDTDDGGSTDTSDAFSLTGPSYVVDGKVYRITGAGEYTASGTMTDGRISVEASGQDVILILNGVTISSSDGPAILALNAATVTVRTASGSINVLSDGGSDADYDGTIFSSVPLILDGTGDLVVVGNNQEGIASDSSMTVNSGNIWIKAVDDGLNTGADLIVNGGYIYVDAAGDGLDSNANLAITGGTIISLGGMEGGDGGIDKDDGFTFALTGGTVIATGNEIVLPNNSSPQTSMRLVFQSDMAAGTIVHIEGATETLTFTPARTYRSFFYSSPTLSAGSYAVYSGGSVTGTSQDGLYDAAATYSGGTAQTHSGSTEGVFEVTADAANTFSNVGVDQSSGGSINPGNPGGPQRP